MLILGLAIVSHRVRHRFQVHRDPLANYPHVALALHPWSLARLTVPTCKQTNKQTLPPDEAGGPGPALRPLRPLACTLPLGLRPFQPPPPNCRAYLYAAFRPIFRFLHTRHGVFLAQPCCGATERSGRSHPHPFPSLPQPIKHPPLGSLGPLGVAPAVFSCPSTPSAELPIALPAPSSWPPLPPRPAPACAFFVVALSP